MARTRGSAGFCAFWNRTAAFWAALGGAPTTHFWNTSATRLPRPAAVVIGLAHRSGNPCREVTAPEPVYLAQFAATLSRPDCTTGLPFAAVRVAPPMMLLMARAATARLSMGFAGL